MSLIFRVIHMRDDGFGFPLCNSLQLSATTADPTGVTCKKCQRILAKRSEK